MNESGLADWQAVYWNADRGQIKFTVKAYFLNGALTTARQMLPLYTDEPEVYKLIRVIPLAKRRYKYGQADGASHDDG